MQLCCKFFEPSFKKKKKINFATWKLKIIEFFKWNNQYWFNYMIQWRSSCIWTNELLFCFSLCYVVSVLNTLLRLSLSQFVNLWIIIEHHFLVSMFATKVDLVCITSHISHLSCYKIIYDIGEDIHKSSSGNIAIQINFVGFPEIKVNDSAMSSSYVFLLPPQRRVAKNRKRRSC